jgi:DNA-directed RNA polymerase subunit beta'
VITRDDDCGTEEGTWITRRETEEFAGNEEGAFRRRLVGRLAAGPVLDPKAKKKADPIVERNVEISEEIAARIDAAGIDEVLVRSPLTCQSRHGVCRACYGRDLATGRLVGIGEAVGIIAAQSIGEPGTQLTMRTFHTGGVAGLDITAGLPRVEELFEARIPKGKAEISHIDGIVEIIRGDGMTKVKVVSTEVYDTSLPVPKGAEMLAAPGDVVTLGQVLARSEADGATTDVTAPVGGFLVSGSDGLVVRAEDVVEREYLIPHNAKLLVESGQEIRAGDAITDGPINPQEYLDTRGKDAVQRYLVKEVQKVYKSQGVTINDKHIEIIVRQMLRKVRIDQPGDVDLLPTELVDRLEFEEHNNHVLAEGGEPATAQTVLLGVTKASLNTSSFLAAASFQETTRVLTEAAINGAKDHLIGLKENVIIGKLIPAGSGAPANVAARKARERQAALEALAGEALEGLGEAEYNPFLEDGRGADRDEETAGLALAAEIAGKDGDGDDVEAANPFLVGDATSAEPEAEPADAANPSTADEAEKEDAPA